MSSPLLGNEEEGISNASLVTSASVNSVTQKDSGLKERNYLGLSDCSSVDSSPVSCLLDERNRTMNMKATELRLGLPGSQSPERSSELHLLSSQKLDEKPLFPLLPSIEGICASSHNVSGSKRGFSETVCGFSEMKSAGYTQNNWMFHSAGLDSDSSKSHEQGKLAMDSLASRPSGGQPSMVMEVNQKAVPEKPRVSSVVGHNQINASKGSGSAPLAKAQVVGWPPIRAYRKNTLATTSKNNEEVDGKPGAGPLFVKVSMDGAPYLRKVDLRSYNRYQELSSALEKMFSCFTIGQCGSHGAPGRELLSESKLRDLLHGSEYVLTYEDKDGDWMLVGDVPWEMFIDSCKKLKIMKSSDAIGLAPRVMEKTRNRN